MVNANPANPVNVAVLTPAAETYKSLRERIVSLAALGHVDTNIKHAFTIAACKEVLKGFTGQRMFLCCDVADTREESADQIQDYFMDLWQAPQQTQEWIAARPLLGMSEDPDIIDEMLRIAKRHPRQHGEIVASIPIPGKNRWRDTKEALLRCLQHA
jgi:hypothetical protein